MPGRTVQYIAPAHYAALTAEFEARGKLLQLKAHTEVLALLRAVEEGLVAEPPWLKLSISGSMLSW